VGGGFLTFNILLHIRVLPNISNFVYQYFKKAPKFGDSIRRLLCRASLDEDSILSEKKALISLGIKISKVIGIQNVLLISKIKFF
jgi:hypothetical protein